MTDPVTPADELFDSDSQLLHWRYEFVPSRFHVQRVVVHHDALGVRTDGPDEGREAHEIRFVGSMPKELPRSGGGVELLVPADIRIATYLSPVSGELEEWIVGSNPVARVVDPTSVPDLALRFASAGLSMERMLGFVKAQGMPEIDCVNPPSDHGVRAAQFRHSSARLRFLIALVDAVECDCTRFFLRYRSLIAELAVHYQRRLVELDVKPFQDLYGIIDETAFLRRQRYALKQSGFDEYLSKLHEACEVDPREAAILLLNLQFNYYAGSPHRTIGFERDKGIISSTYAAGFLEFIYWQLYELYARNRRIKLCVECWSPFQAKRRDAKRCKACRSSGATRKRSQRRRERNTDPGQL